MQKFVCAVSLVVLIVCGGCRNPWMENVLINLYHIGDKGPGGGIIFYRSAKGFTDTYSGKTHHFLEVAPDEMPGLEWATFATPAGYYEVSGTGTAIGTGRKNTDVIIKCVNDNAGTPSSDCRAADACRQYTSGGKTDWFLPSIDELQALYKSGLLTGSNYYWSSSDYGDDNSVWVCSFINGDSFDLLKDDNCYVRAVRSF